MGILVIAEHDGIELKSGTLNTITAAGEIGSDISLSILTFSTTPVTSLMSWAWIITIVSCPK